MVKIKYDTPTKAIPNKGFSAELKDSASNKH